MDETTQVEVREVLLQLVAYTRSLQLCARMNRELEILDFIDSIPQGGVLYDLGAAEGRFALYAALKGICVYAFEPEQQNYEALLANIALNALPTGTFLQAIQKGVGHTNQQATIKIGQPWAGGHQKVVDIGPGRSDLHFDFQDEQIVEIVSLDSYISEHNLRLPNYLKVDIDGSEIPFLEGAKQTLKAQDLKGIVIELYRADSSYSKVLSYLNDIDFRVVSEHEIENEPDLVNVLLERT